MYSDEINKLSKKIITIGAKNKVLISTAESCTGGMIGSVITSVPGSSSVYDRGFVTYSNESKAELLDIDINLINKYLKQSEIEIIVDLNIGVYEWSTWTCDFTKEYVSINADYRS